MALKTRHLRRIGDGALYPWTPTLAKRKDMVIMDDEKAARRLSAIREQIADTKKPMEPQDKAKAAEAAKKSAKLALELTEAEKELDALREQPPMPDVEKKPVETPTDIEENTREKRILNDPDMNAILAMSTGAALAKYIRREFGEEADARSTSVGDLRKQALELRTNRIFEAD